MIVHLSQLSHCDLTDRGEEDDGEEISDWLDAAHDLCGNHVTLCGQQGASQETAQLHGNIEKLCHLQRKSPRETALSSQEVKQYDICREMQES